MEKKVILEDHEYIEILEYDDTIIEVHVNDLTDLMSFTVNILSDCMHITILVLSYFEMNVILIKERKGNLPHVEDGALYLKCKLYIM